jgi:hypothetical protein
VVEEGDRGCVQRGKEGTHLVVEAVRTGTSYLMHFSLQGQTSQNALERYTTLNRQPSTAPSNISALHLVPQSPWFLIRIFPRSPPPFLYSLLTWLFSSTSLSSSSHGRDMSTTCFEKSRISFFQMRLKGFSKGAWRAGSKRSGSMRPWRYCPWAFQILTA